MFCFLQKNAQTKHSQNTQNKKKHFGTKPRADSIDDDI